MKKLSIIASILLTTYVNADDSPLEFDSSIPPSFLGFEEQMIFGYVDFRFENKILPKIKVSYNNNYIQIEEPEDFISKLISVKDIKIEYIPKIKDIISKKMENNLKYLCKNKNTCLSVPEAEDIFLIFNPRDLVADIKINSEYVYQSYISNTNILKDPVNALSLYNRLNTSFNGDIEDLNQENAQIDINSILAYGNKKLNFNYGYAKSDSYISILNYEQESFGYTFVAGSFLPNRLSSLYNRENIFGVSMGTSKNTREDFKNDYAKPLLLSVPMKSFVKIMKEGNVIYQEVLESGLQEITIPSLPSGISDLEVIMTDDFGQTTKNNITYSKNTNILNTKDYIWNLSFGKKLDNINQNLKYQSPFDAMIQETYGLVTVQKVLNDFNMIGAEFILDNNEPLYSLNHTYQINKIDNLSAIIIGDNYTELSLNLNYNEINNKFYSNFRYKNNKEEIDTYQLDFSYYHNFDNDLHSSLSLNYNYDELNDEDINYKGSIVKQFEINKNNYFSVELYAEYNNSENVYGLQIEFNSNGLLNKRAELDYSNKDYGFQKNLSLTKNNMKKRYSTSHSLNYQSNDINNSLNFSNNFSSDDYGYGNITYHNQNNNNSSLLYGNYNTSFIVTPNSVVLGGSKIKNSGVIIDFDKKDYGKKFILKDGNSNSEIIASDKVFVGLNNYKEYHLSLEKVDNSNSFNKVDEKVLNMTLYEGNIVDVHWEVYNYKVFYGQFKDENKKPISYAIISTPYENSFSDEQGFFSINIKNKKDIKVEGYKCDFDDIDLNKNIIIKKDISCLKNKEN